MRGACALGTGLLRLQALASQPTDPPPMPADNPPTTEIAPQRKPAAILGVVFLTVFLDLVGFGIVIPLLPLMAEDFGASGWMVGAIMAAYSLMQFMFSPLWGRWSDRIGRRPLMLFGTAGAAAAYAIFALGAGLAGSAALAVFFGARLLAGFCGANLAVAQAAIADVTPPEKRSKSMALIGIAFGLGFILGPFLGGQAMRHFGMSGPGWLAAVFCGGNFVAAYFLLPETRRPGAPAARPRPRFAQWQATLRQPQVGLLILVFFLATLSFAAFETTLGLLLSKRFGLDYRGADATVIGNLFAFCGLVGVLAQGGLIGRLVKHLGEKRLIALSLALVALALGPLPFVVPAGAWPLPPDAGFFAWLVALAPLLAVLAVLSVGSSLTRPPVFGLISRLTSADEQGATLGVAQSAGSLARIIGPVAATSLFFVNPAWPYLACAGLTFATAVLVMIRLGVPPPQPDASPGDSGA
jgi:MFS transporter, DHA1 family, tetracycline resistance protein